MASTKFLPFITEKSAPAHVFDTLLSRSKGLSRSALTTLFYLIMHHGIKNVRAKAAELTNVPPSNLFQELTVQYPEKISEKDIAIFTGMKSYFSAADNRWSDTLDKFPVEDTLCFLLVMAKLDRESEVTDLPFSDLLNHEVILANLPNYIDLSDTGKRVSFKTAEELKTFILYTALFMENPPAYCLSLAPQTEEDEDALPF